MANSEGGPEDRTSKPSTHGDEAAAVTVGGIDIGRDFFHFVAFDAGGKVAFRRKIKRLQLADTITKLPSCLVGMEACLSARSVSRKLEQLGRPPKIPLHSDLAAELAHVPATQLTFLQTACGSGSRPRASGN
jgi:hypothetical protein